MNKKYNEKLIFSLIFIFWIILNLAILIRQNSIVESNIRTIALFDARSYFKKDILYRKWNTLEGGVYAFKSEYSKPNPNLKVPERDTVTKDGRELTYINPAYMTRKVHNLEKEMEGVKNNITSLNPLRP